MEWTMDTLTTDDYENITSVGHNRTSFDYGLPYYYGIPIGRQIMWTLLFSIIAIVGTTGNSIVIWIVLAHKQMRTVTDLFIVNLAITDGLVALLNVTFTSYSLIYYAWPFGQIYCKISEFIATMSMIASVLTLSAIAIDRYIAIINPFQKRLGKKKTVITIVVIWITSTVLSCPHWIFVTTYSAPADDAIGLKERMYCSSVWPDTVFEKYQQQLYSIIFMVITYFLPLACMTFTYTKIGKKLWGDESIGEQTQNQLENIQAKRKIVKMMIIVVVIFAVCWLPFQLYFHLHFIITTISGIDQWPLYMEEIFLACFWLAMSNSMYNPLIYCWMNGNFRDGFKKAFRLCPCVKYTAENALNDKVLN